MKPLKTLKVTCKHKWLYRKRYGTDVKICAKCSKQLIVK